MKPHHPPAPASVYTCPMHPEVQQDRQGKCPKCSMQLVPKDLADTPQHSISASHSTIRRHEHAGEHGGHDMSKMDTHGDMTEMTRFMRRQWLWTNFTVAGLGFWLITSPFTFGYIKPGMIWSDVISGALIVLFSLLALSPKFDFIGRWSASIVGTWLQFAPLVFWASTPAAFVNDTLIGALVIVFTVLVPSMPGMAHHMEMAKPGPVIPPGWSYNPSSWHQRAPMILAAFAGWLISRYLAAFQLGYIPTVWEPFFAEGTARVLTSDVSQKFPISDAGLGAAAYTLEMLMAFMGGETRWRSMPWMVTGFFILVVPLGVISIVLVTLQPVAVGYWCTLCLATALIMLLMIPFTVDELVAMGQFLRQSVREGKPFWRTFWVGGTLDQENRDMRTPRYGAPVAKLLPAAAWGVTMPWNLIVSALLGIWLMFTPVILGSTGRAANSDHIVGALIITVAVIATAEVIRAGRFLNILFGAWVIAAPWLLAGANTGTKWNNAVAGIVLILISFPRGTIKEQYAAWNP
ncbi:copper-transporting P-type ATPase [bacterium BMS3Bbin08]|nr:copper-transporting P-type ATPase [bacterium BMS3Bbin08]